MYRTLGNFPHCLGEIAGFPPLLSRPAPKKPVLLTVSGGTTGALFGSAVTLLHMRLAALSVVAVMIATTGGAVFVQAIHSVCVAKQHDCGKSATISNCCCGDQDTTRTDATPVQSRVEVHVDLPATPVLPNVVSIAPAPQGLGPVRTSPSRLCLLDLPTLFSSFLI